MTLSRDGNVGIGTSAPTRPLNYCRAKVDTSESGSGRAYTSGSTTSWTGNIGEVSQACSRKSMELPIIIL